MDETSTSCLGLHCIDTVTGDLPRNLYVVAVSTGVINNEASRKRVHLSDFPFFIASAVLVAFGSSIVLMAALGLADKIFFFLLLTFVLSAGTALWCAFSRNWIIDYAVWTMYLSGLVLAILMILRMTPKRRSSRRKDFQDSRADN